jgi:hypothetical protein
MKIPCSKGQDLGRQEKEDCSFAGVVEAFVSNAYVGA